MSLVKQFFAAIRRLSKLLIASYILDWIVICLLAGAGRLFSTRLPYHRPFSPADLSISFPLTSQRISVLNGLIIAAGTPAVAIFVVCLACVPGPKISRHTPTGMLWRRKLWELHVGYLGLALSFGLTFLFTDSIKNLTGKPRPDFLSRCNPDLDNIAAHVVGDYTRDLSSGWVLVRSSICQNTDQEVINDGFRSFPSGHSSGSWAGLLYLALFLCSKFSIIIPYLPLTPSAGSNARRASAEYSAVAPRLITTPPSPSNRSNRNNLISHNQPDIAEGSFVPIRNRAAAPPLYLFILALVPVGAAVYISCSRYFDFRHHPTDILAGSLIGISAAWFSFRWYHMPVRRGAGWAWGPRDADRAFGIGVGIGSYVTEHSWQKNGENADLEMGPMAPGHSTKYENGSHPQTASPGSAMSFERPETGHRQQRYENFLADQSPADGYHARI